MTGIAEMTENQGFHFVGHNGQTVLLIHGLTGAPSEMAFVGRLLHRKGYTVVCPLLAGHGSGENVIVRSHWEDWYQSVEAAALKLTKNNTRIHVAGICAGGLLGLMLALRHRDKVASVALYSATLTYNGWGIPKSRVILPMVRWWGKLPVVRYLGWPEKHPFGLKDDRIRQKTVQMMMADGCLPSFPFGSIAELYRLSAYVKRQLRKIVTPVLLVHSSQDDVSDISNAEIIRRQLGGPSMLRVLKDSYHMIHVDRERDKVASFSADFFEQYAMREPGIA